VGALPERLSRDARGQQEALLAAVRSELRRAVSALASEESAAIARLDARLAVRRAAARTFDFERLDALAPCHAATPLCLDAAHCNGVQALAFPP
jgi:hypothetical protein